jgi:hypothetical protein
LFRIWTGVGTVHGEVRSFNTTISFRRTLTFHPFPYSLQRSARAEVLVVLLIITCKLCFLIRTSPCFSKLYPSITSRSSDRADSEKRERKVVTRGRPSDHLIGEDFLKFSTAQVTKLHESQSRSVIGHPSQPRGVQVDNPTPWTGPGSESEIKIAAQL